MHVRWLGDEEAARRGFEGAPAGKQMVPSHQGAVVALLALPGGCLASGAHDGTLRVWDVAAGVKLARQGRAWWS